MYTYSVMQSDGNSFCGDVVSDSFNKQSRDENNILDQIFKSTYVRIIIMTIFIPYDIIRKCLLIGTCNRTKTQFNEFFVVLWCIYINVYILQSLQKFKISIIKFPKYLLFIFLVLNAVFISIYHLKAAQDDISARTVPI